MFLLALSSVRPRIEWMMEAAAGAMPGMGHGPDHCRALSVIYFPFWPPALGQTGT